jgi:hypothetical protein
MAILCPECGHEFDVTLFAFESTVRCDCGAVVSALEPHRAAPPADRRARRLSDEIARGSDRIASLILYGDTPEVDIRIAIERLRDRAEELFPGRGWFFEAVYKARFDRLIEQWREGSDPAWGQTP